MLDWFHIAMRFRVLTQTAKGLGDKADPVRGWMIETLERAWWHLWHGHQRRAGELLQDVHAWTKAKRAKTTGVADLQQLLGTNRDSLPSYACRRQRVRPAASSPCETALRASAGRSGAAPASMLAVAGRRQA